MQLQPFQRFAILRNKARNRLSSRGLAVIEILMLTFIAAIVVIVIWTLLDKTAMPKMKAMVELVFGSQIPK